VTYEAMTPMVLSARCLISVILITVGLCPKEYDSVVHLLGVVEHAEASYVQSPHKRILRLLSIIRPPLMVSGYAT